MYPLFYYLLAIVLSDKNEVIILTFDFKNLSIFKVDYETQYALLAGNRSLRIVSNLIFLFMELGKLSWPIGTNMSDREFIKIPL